MGDQNVYPGPVDNSGLLRGKTSPLGIYCKYYVAHMDPCVQDSLIILEVVTKSSEEKGTKTTLLTDPID